MKNKLLIGTVALCLAGAWAGWQWSHRGTRVGGIPNPAGAEVQPPEPQSPVTTGRTAPPARSPAVEKAADSVSPVVRDYLDSAVSDPARHAVSRSLPEKPTPADLKALSEFLCREQALDETEFGQGVKNEILDHLCELNPEGLRAMLGGMIEDRALNPVIRDYALQHLMEHWQRLAGSGPDEMSRREREEGIRAMWTAAEETGNSLAGTALLGLSRLSELEAGIDRGQVAAAALRLAADPTTGEAARIAAFQVCGRLQAAGVLPAAWEAARSNGSLPLRISAIGTLGLLAGTDAGPFLRAVEGGEESALKPAATRALREIARREAQRAQASRGGQ